MSRNDKKWQLHATVYDPLVCGSIDGTDMIEHDKGIIRASQAQYKPDKKLKGNAKHTIFAGRLNDKTDEECLQKVFSRYGKIINLKLVRDIITGTSKKYAFIEFDSFSEAKAAYKYAHETVIDGCCILVDWEHSRTLPGWVPRRLGGGFGGKKESGQLRFGCRDRPFKRPFNLLQGDRKYQDFKQRRDSSSMKNYQKRTNF